MIVAPIIPGDLLAEGVAIKAIGIEVIETVEPLTREGSELSVAKLAASDLIEVTDAVQPLGVVKGVELLAMPELIASHKRLMAADNVMRDVPAMVGPAAQVIVMPDAAEMRATPSATKTASGEVRTTKMRTPKVGTAKMPAAAEMTAKAAMPGFGDRDNTCYRKYGCCNCNYRPHGRAPKGHMQLRLTW
jgi:hypothetical protein